MIRAVAAQPPYTWIYGDHIEWSGIHCLLVKETPGGVRKTLVDPRTIEEVEEGEAHDKNN